MKVHTVSGLLLLALCSCTLAREPRRVEVRGGVADLTAADPRTHGPVLMDGEWLLYWDELLVPGQKPRTQPQVVEVPGRWPNVGHPADGVASYCVQIRVPAPGGRYALLIPDIDSAYRVYADGVQIGGVGKVGLSRKDYEPGDIRTIAPFTATAATVEIIMHVANFDTPGGGMLGSILLGTEADIRELNARALSRHFFFIGIILTMGLYHLGLFLFRRSDRSNLLFAAFTLVFALRMVSAEMHYVAVVLPWVPWHIWMRVEYLAFYGVSVLYFAFLMVLFPGEVDRRVFVVFSAIAAAFGLLPLVAPPNIFMRTLLAFSAVFLATMLYLLGVLVVACARRRIGSVVMLVGFLTAVGASVNDVLFFNGIINTGALASYGLVGFFLAQSLLLARRFSISFVRVEQLVEHLDAANRTLVEQRTKIEFQHAEMARLAHYDTLTGVRNRLALLEIVANEISRARRNTTLVAVLFLDLDGFKNVNDAMGHPAGDELLRRVAERIGGAMRRHDELFRLGGDEFAIVLLDLERRDQVQAASNKLLKALAQPMDVGKAEVLVRASVGISLFPDDGDDVHTLLQKADVAMYRVKKSSKGDCAFFEPGMIQENEQVIALSGRMPRALEAGRFSLAYQPLVRGSDGVLWGVEALARWTEPGHGVISPGRFIPIAEETGFIVTLGEWVLRAACEQAGAWQRAGVLVPHLAVNISARQFSGSGFSTTIRAILEETGAHPESLVLEVTESALMREGGEMAVRLKELKDLGIRIAIDDFGTGYSSLNYLRRFPLDHLKIDQSFVRGMFQNEYDAEIVRTIIGLADILRLEAVAEGVETDVQRQFLSANGCALMQGYLFGKPGAASEISTLAAQPGPVAAK
jgi:diguanylate cyclase (GGDEF)-like protein